jgi:hypothetical protein
VDEELYREGGSAARRSKEERGNIYPATNKRQIKRRPFGAFLSITANLSDYRGAISSRDANVTAQAIALMRAVRRDSLRETVLRWITPRVVPRCSSGWASLNSA